MAMLQSLKVYLGLGPDEEYDDSYLDVEGYDDYDDYDEPAELTPSDRPSEFDAGSVVRTTRRTGSANTSGSNSDYDSGAVAGSVRPLRPVPAAEVDDAPAFPRRSSGGGAPRQSVDQDSSVRPVRFDRAKPHTVAPESFGDAKVIADEFKRSTPVVMNMQGLPKDLARRLIDFASGVCYIEGGSMEKLAPNVFLLTPKSVEVSDEERRRLEERGFDRS